MGISLSHLVTRNVGFFIALLPGRKVNGQSDIERFERQSEQLTVTYSRARSEWIETHQRGSCTAP